ncbi:histidine kinase [Paenibacillus sp. FSL R7-0273]|uniref:sensor histidine kinase n=1 Tax=Paenibacillus sp. FSL R7-0273 TaxID=1536772 RepID=UPI0004F758F2|nr:HAMP domain-containing sensor histidine kinase [Paenibacillus sp. FSL R7-0273]AIQ47407.1 histidine kinase [Paenibacillus sp. FSL R7-0273]OMF96039.1 two-component sensor histidine kinase [Paenibacillus sp. FSL R7-0273]
MTEAAKQSKRKQKIQVNILLSMLLSLILAVTLNNVLIYFVFQVGTGLDWLEKIFPYLITPFFIIVFIITFLMSTRRIVKDLMTLEQGLQTITEGDLSYRVPVNRQDELGRVAFNINRMTERLEQQIAKERAAEQSKMELITGLSHDLRTPLTSIIGYIELLRSNSFQDQEEYVRFVQNTYNKAAHLKKLLDDLFEYTRLSSVDPHLNAHQIDLCQLLNQLLFEFEPIACENELHIIKELGSSPVLSVVDSDKIARAIDNLLMNALKYSFKPGAIRIRMVTDSKQVTIEVENRGTPLTREQQDKLFERFYKADHSRSSEGLQTGAGLGLSIARNIAELHGGSLTLNHLEDLFNFKLKLPLEADG